MRTLVLALSGQQQLSLYSTLVRESSARQPVSRGETELRNVKITLILSLIRATRRLSGSLYLLLFKKVRSNRLLNIINLILRSDD